MQITKQLPNRIRDWLNARGIDDLEIERAHLAWDGERIVIPVFDQSGNPLFFKFRRDPDVQDGPKYMYQSGSTSQIYNLHRIKDATSVVICEGEFDAMILTAHGIPAVTSTGGAGTFKKEWADYFLDKEVFICFDHDDPGYKGAYAIQAIIPWAKIVWLPDEVGDHGDITDYFIKLGKSSLDFAALMNSATSYEIPLPLAEEPKTKKAMSEYIKNDERIADIVLQEQRDLKAKNKDWKRTQVLIDYLLNRVANNRRKLKYMGRREVKNPERLKAAKAVPIDRYIKFNAEGKACCIWHNEKTPSMQWYPKDFRVKCFGCGRMGDVIDVVQELRKVEVKEAIEIILNNK